MRLLIDLEPADPRRGLATDEALLESVRSGAEAAVRLWVNNRAVIVGRSQSVSDEVDGAFVVHSGIPVLRRISGGGTVYHYPGNLNVSIALRNGRRIGSVREAFRFFGGAIATALADVCPAISPDENDLLIGAAKVGGAAQARRGDALLYHTTLLVGPADIPMERLLLAMRPGYRPRRVASRPRRTVSLSEALGRDLPMERVAEALVTPLSASLAEPLVTRRLDSHEERRVRQLAETKYGDPRWNRSL
jgi:lipoate-protein ligase A